MNDNKDFEAAEYNKEHKVVTVKLFNGAVVEFNGVDFFYVVTNKLVIRLDNVLVDNSPVVEWKQNFPTVLRNVILAAMAEARSKWNHIHGKNKATIKIYTQTKEIPLEEMLDKIVEWHACICYVAGMGASDYEIAKIMANEALRTDDGENISINIER